MSQTLRRRADPKRKMDWFCVFVMATRKMHAFMRCIWRPLIRKRFAERISSLLIKYWSRKGVIVNFCREICIWKKGEKANITIHYEKWHAKNFNTYSLDHFVRHQRVSECWRNVDGQWKLIPIEFERGRQADSNGYCKSLAGIFGCYVQASAEGKTA